MNASVASHKPAAIGQRELIVLIALLIAGALSISAA